MSTGTKNVFCAIELNKIKIMLQTLFIIAVAHAFKSYELCLLYKKCFYIEHAYTFSINK